MNILTQLRQAKETFTNNIIDNADVEFDKLVIYKDEDGIEQIEKPAKKQNFFERYGVTEIR